MMTVRELIAVLESLAAPDSEVQVLCRPFGLTAINLRTDQVIDTGGIVFVNTEPA